MEKKYPFFFRSTVTLFGIILFVFVLHILRGIMVPLAFALMIAILLNPFVNILINKKSKQSCCNICLASSCYCFCCCSDDFYFLTDWKIYSEYASSGTEIFPAFSQSADLAAKQLLLTDKPAKRTYRRSRQQP